MKGLNYQSKLTYTYSMPYEQMKKILEMDGFNCFTLNDDLKIIEYSIDHSKAIQLSLLLYLLDIDLIRFTIAQQIQLCLNIYAKHLQFEQQNIQHKYLSSDRIWLKVINNQQITILPRTLHYTVHFVGFDCPFYEKDDYQNSQTIDKQTIINIIRDILEQLKKKKLEKQKSNEKYKLLKDIFEQLLDKGIYQSHEQFQHQVETVFIKYQCKNQRLIDKVDKEVSSYSKRGMRVKDVVENLHLIISNNYKKGQFYSFQQILYSTFPKMAKELKNAIFYFNQEPENIIVNYFDQILFIIDDKYIEELINKNKQIIMKDFKFEIDMQEIKDIIKTELQNEFKILNYFLNQVKYQNKKFDQIIGYFYRLKNDLTVRVVIQILKDELKLLTLKLIDDLI
ncbi:unnamed protein product [Paramecium octaurelia]|uniref:Uncharacterized protein n=1 Tax=Paramecium octaurelia TaxID=43137 RepID=A0A8S1T7N4_PAROT|nr:unnamed protein product [Paramecium octaurelia]